MGAETKPQAIEIIGEIEYPPTIIDYESDKPQDECAVGGVIIFDGNDEVLAGEVAYDLMDRQDHRGHSATGVAVENPVDGSIQITKGLGKIRHALPNWVKNRQKPADRIRSKLNIIHDRYATCESSEIEGAHPHPGEKSGVAVAHNGHFVFRKLEFLVKKYKMNSENYVSDSQLFTGIVDECLAAKEKKTEMTTETTGKTLASLFAQVDGAYCLTMMYKGKLIAARDPEGRHPLSIASLKGGGRVVASESIAFENQEIVEGSIRDVEPGEVIIIDKEGNEDSFHIPKASNKEHCIFEHIYTAHEESTINGSPNDIARYKKGQSLAENAPVDADYVIGVPNTGLKYTEGFSDASGIPFLNAIIKNPKASDIDIRSFLLRGEAREKALEEKFMLDEQLVEQLEGQVIVIVDDSGIKGNVARRIRRLFGGTGVKEIHFRFGSPRYEKPCEYGMDTAHEDELIARHGRSLEEIADDLGDEETNSTVESVGYNTFHAVELAIDEAKNEAERKSGILTPSLIGNFCWRCTNTENPYEQLSAEQSTQEKLGETALALR